MADIEIRDLHVEVGEKSSRKEILSGVSLDINQGDIVALMGPNGSGKSTLAYVLAGHPSYHVTRGSVRFHGKDLLAMKPHERSRAGLFLSFQYPAEVSGVTVSNFLRTAMNARLSTPVKIADFAKLLKEKMSLLKVDQKLVNRYLNEGFSGGEKKRCEILQLAMLQPQFAVLDETDSGTDVDALKVLGEGISTIARSTKMGVLLITHYNRILQYVKPSRVHILVNGKIVKSGGFELAEHIEKHGFDSFINAEVSA
ncbi:MAG: Fe-S cluster assembly ATPase SufC [Candidatus Diapherotrites archaeon]|uniref:Fe-S cluster assembly ATPase SufC n=1 Tax=Candidatus Iainarchaeum sp. TaxID=3101447 RepID=A0A8T4C8R4_9ARCH|nr:Fe-S cluster assembly ATPase SufC [Candidatus Diapherotrites archaeon]